MQTAAELREPSGTQVALLHRISSIVSSDQALESMLKELVSLTMNVTHSDACLVYLVDRMKDAIRRGCRSPVRPAMLVSRGARLRATGRE